MIKPSKSENLKTLEREFLNFFRFNPLTRAAIMYSPLTNKVLWSLSSIASISDSFGSILPLMKRHISVSISFTGIFGLSRFTNSDKFYRV